jgi:outer membrane protein assembly factor BamB
LIAVRRIDSVSTLADIRGRPVVDRGVAVALSHSGRMAAIDLRSGNRIWDRDIGGTEMPWVAGDFIFVLTNDSQLICLTRRDGRVRWATAVRQYRDAEKKRDRIFWSGPVLVSDRLVLLGSHGEALAISPYTGDQIGAINLSAGAFIAPVVAGGTLYVLTDNATLLALR